MVGRRNLRDYYAGRTSGDIPRPPRTLVQQNTVINDITKNKTEKVNVNKNINITHIQNVNALTTVTKIHNTTVTSLAPLNAQEPGGKEFESHILKVETMPKEQQAEALKAVAQSREAAQQRHQAEAKILADGAAPVKETDAPKPVAIQPPKTTPLPPSGPKPAPPPPSPKQPTHVEKPIPHHEPPKPARPPKK